MRISEDRLLLLLQVVEGKEPLSATTVATYLVLRRCT